MEKQYRIAIIDDEAPAREVIKGMLELLQFPHSIVGEATSVVAARQLLKTEKPEIVLLDIQLTDGTGFDVLRDLVVDFDFHLLFITAHNSYALKAFEFAALDYILKPLSVEKIEKALGRVLHYDHKLREERLKIAQDLIDSKPSPNIVLKTLDEFHLVPAVDIVYCKASGSYTEFHLENGKKILTSKNLKEYEGLLAEDHFFFRCHHSYLVNLRKISIYHADGNAVLKNGERIPVSVRRKEEFIRLLATR